MSKHLGLASDTLIDVVRINQTTKEYFVKEMTVAEWLNLKKNPKFTYRAYQKGFSAFPNVKKHE
ncbi:MAG: hypothetical protein KDC72_01145 [Bacteroidetes bacterium]|nr:hypothetical protein [Bacteroidota bacterium]